MHILTWPRPVEVFGSVWDQRRDPLNIESLPTPETEWRPFDTKNIVWKSSYDFRYVAGSNIPQGTTGSGRQTKDKIRNPTILRKSKFKRWCPIHIITKTWDCQNPDDSNFYLTELDVCIYLMSAVGVKMEVEEGASATVAELVNTLLDEDELGLPRNNQHINSNSE